MNRWWLALILAFTSLSRAHAAGSCVVTTHATKLSQIQLGDLDGRFSDFETHLRKGLSVTLLSDVAAGERSFTFGCRIFYDLWDETYFVVPIVGAVEVKDKTSNLKRMTGLPEACVKVSLPWSLRKGETVEVTTKLNPVTDEQLAKTRKWLAERGIGANGALAGRAAYAMVDLHQTQSFQRRCPAP